MAANILSQHPKISVITPCYNAARYIQETVESVVNNTAFQHNLASLQYIVCDGASTDNTLNIVDKVFSTVNRNNIDLKILSEPDNSMYEALAKGLQIASGELTCYINAGDFYAPTAFEIVPNIFKTQNVQWLTGINAFFNEQSHLIGTRVPFKYRSALIQCGLYNKKVLPFIQQEATFWHSSLNSLLDYDKLKSFKYAGDYYLWHQFSKNAHLYIVQAWLGGYKFHQNRLSENMSAYYQEMNAIRKTPTLIEYLRAWLDKPLWYLPTTVKKWLNPNTLYRFDLKTQKYL